jgi:ABC-2 type transport system ATP-binding protein
MLGSLSASVIVILSTHIVEDIESTCENIAILDNGKLHTQESRVNYWRQLKDLYGAD